MCVLDKLLGQLDKESVEAASGGIERLDGDAGGFRNGPAPGDAIAISATAY